MKKTFYIVFFVSIAVVLFLLMQRKTTSSASIRSTTSVLNESAKNNEPILENTKKIDTTAENKPSVVPASSSDRPKQNIYSNATLIRASDLKNSIKWLDKSEAASIPFDQIRSKASSLTSSEAKRKAVRTKKEAVAHIEANLAMAKRPAAAYEDDNFFYFSGGTTAFVVRDFSTGLTVSKATGEIKGW